ncbi:MAG: FAD/NAD(P)-binding oxidoreductase [Butyricimonas faecihominis]
MLVDGKVRRICVTKVDGVKEVREFAQGEMAEQHAEHRIDTRKVLRTTVVIVGAGPAGLAVREEFEKYGIDNIVIDNNDKIGGQFNMQTHQFFFFEKEKRFGGMRGFDIAKTLAGENMEGIYLNSTVWDILEGKRVAVKNWKRIPCFSWMPIIWSWPRGLFRLCRLSKTMIYPGYIRQLSSRK